MTGPSHQRGEPFFTWLAIVTLLVVLAGFAPSFYVRAAHRPTLGAVFVWHGICLTAWYVLMVLQAALACWRSAATGMRWHRRLGLASTALALSVIVSGAIVAVDFYQSGSRTPILSPEGLLVANLMNLVGYSICFVAGICLRRRADLHKRLLSMSGIVMIGPAAFRLVVALGLAPPWSLVVQFGLCGALFVYDRRRLGRIHIASWIGLLLIVAMIAATLAVG